MSARALDRRLWVGGGVLTAALLVTVSWLVVIGPHRADTDQLHQDTDSAQLQNDVLASKTAKLRREAEGRPRLQSELRTALQQLPADSALPAFGRQLVRHAAPYHITVTGISIGTSTLATPATATAPAPAPDPGTTDPTGATDPTTPASPAPVASPTVLAIPITVVTKGPAIEQLRFLKEVQQSGPRRALVTGVSMTAEDVPSVAIDATMTTQLTVFSSALTSADRARMTRLLGGGDGSQ